MRSSLLPRRLAPYGVAAFGWLSRPLPLLAAVLVAALSGFANAAAFPSLGWP